MTERNLPVRVAIVTGSRADYGLLAPVIRACRNREGIHTDLIVTGMHTAGDGRSLGEIAEHGVIAARVDMQTAAITGRDADVTAAGKGIVGIGEALDRLQSNAVIVLGDRVEAFAGAAAGAIGGRIVAHIHGGDRAEGVADESMRHAITKLAHIHLAASNQSATRIRRMGEDPDWVLEVGSPAVDGLVEIPPANDDTILAYGVEDAKSFAIVLQHPCGLSDREEEDYGNAVVRGAEQALGERQCIFFAPNHDPGRDGLLRGLGARRLISHLPRQDFVAMLKRAQVIVGNSSAGLIEAAACCVPCVNVGPRQAGRERCCGVVDIPAADPQAVARGIDQAKSLRTRGVWNHPYGDGKAGERIAAVIDSLRLKAPSIRKRNAY